MKFTCVLSVLLALASMSVAAEVPNPVTDIRVVDGDTLLVRISHTVVDSLPFWDAYSLGGSDDVDDATMKLAVSYVEGFSEDCYPFIVGMADTTGWKDGNPKEDHRKDVSLSRARAQDIYEMVGGKLADYVRLDTTRGFTIYKVRVLREVFRNFSEERRQLAKQLDEAKKKMAGISASRQNRLWALGVSYLNADGFEITTATFNLAWLKGKTRIDVGGGLLPAGTSQEHGGLMNASAAGSYSYFPGDKFIGIYGGYGYSSQVINKSLTATHSYHGPTVGLVLRPSISLFGLEITTLERVGYTHLNHAQIDMENETTNGFIGTAQLGFLF